MVRIPPHRPAFFRRPLTILWLALLLLGAVFAGGIAWWQSHPVAVDAMPRVSEPVAFSQPVAPEEALAPARDRETGVSAEARVLPQAPARRDDDLPPTGKAGGKTVGTKAIAAFQRWSEAYAAALPEVRVAMQAEGRHLAAERGQAMAELIRRDPHEALAAVLPYGLRKALPRDIAERIEHPVRGAGSLRVLATYPLPGQQVDEPIRREVTIGAKTYRTYTYGPRLGQTTTDHTSFLGVGVSLSNGEEVLALRSEPYEKLEAAEAADLKAELGDPEVLCPVSGKPTAATGEESAFHFGEEVIWLCHQGHIEQYLKTPDGLRVLAAGGTGASGGPPSVVSPTHSQGNKKFLAVRVRFANQSPTYEPSSDAYLQNELQTAVNNFAKWSYGKLQSTFAFSPVFTLPQSDIWYRENGLENRLRDDALAAAAAYTDASGAHPYALANFDFPAVVFSTNAFGNYGGLASIGGNWCMIKAPLAYIFCHEWGHNFGLFHSNFWNVWGESPIGGGWNAEYGNPFSVMGSAGGAYGYDLLQRYVLGWVGPSEVTFAETSGTYRIYNADNTALVAGHSFALRVRKDDRTYSLEWRPKNDAAGARPFSVVNGALLLWEQGPGFGSQLLDMHPLTSRGANDAPLLIGRTFSDPGVGLNLTLVGKGGEYPNEYCDVAVNFDQGIFNHPPVVAVSTSSEAPAVAAAVTLTAKAWDPDGHALAYWWDFGDGTYSADNLPIQSKSWGSPGEYVVRCVVSDQHGGTVSQNTLIRVGSPTTYTISGRITGPDGAPMAGVLVGDGSNVTYSDRLGTYTLTGLRDGPYWIGALLDRWTLSPQFVSPITIGPSFSSANFQAIPAGTGGVTVERWENLPGLLVTDLTSSARYPQSPDRRQLSQYWFEQVNSGDQFGRRMSAQFQAPSSGSYRFWIASDENSELWLSSDESAANKVKIASVTGAVGYQSWTTRPSQQSAPISLAAGERYYLEALHKEAFGSDHLSVGVTLPDGSNLRPIPASLLVPTSVPSPPTSVVVSVTASQGAASEAGTAGTFTVSRTGSTAAALEVYFALSGTAAYGIDYPAISLAATIPAGAASKTISIAPLEDALPEPIETVILSLVPALQYGVGPAAVATVKIADNDASQVTMAAATPTALEGGTTPGRLVVTRTGSTAAALTVTYTIGGSAANGSDYSTLATKVVIPINQSSATINIVPLADELPEVEETVVLTLAAGTGYTVGTPASATVQILAQPGNGGGLMHEWYMDVFGPAISNLTNASAYPLSPAGREIFTSAFEAPPNRADYFGERWQALYTAPVSGNYYFSISSDGPSELWLSTDARPECRQRIAFVATRSNFRTWTSFPSQRSAAIPLVAGQRYYMEGLLKEETGADHLSVAVEYPNGVQERPIPGHRFDPYLAGAPLPNVWSGTDVGHGPLGMASLLSDGLSAGPKFRWSFSGGANTAVVSGAALTDSVAGANATVRGAGAVFNAAGNALDLPGGASSTQAYVDLPNGVVTGRYNGGTRFVSASYEAWVTPQSAQSSSRIFDFGTSSIGEVGNPGESFTGSGVEDVYLSANIGTSFDQQLGRSSASGTATRDMAGATVLNVPVHLVLLYDAAKANWRWYRNGVLMQVLPDAQGLATLTDDNNWIGRSMFSTDANSDFAIDELRIYNYALNEAQIRGNITAGPSTLRIASANSAGPFWLSGAGVISPDSVRDTFHFESQSMSGDWDVSVKLTSLGGNDPTAVAGLMMRDGTAPEARHAFLGVTQSRLGRLITRTTAGGNANASSRNDTSFPQWLRLVRVGDTISAFRSDDGTNWWPMKAPTTLPGLADTLQVGLVVAGGSGTSLAEFDRFTAKADQPVTNAASLVTENSAILNGIANPDGLVASVSFQYGPTTAYGSTTPLQDLGSTPGAALISASLTALSANTSYHFRIKCTRSSGTTYGPDLVFTTLHAAPRVTTNAATTPTFEGARLNATVNPGGLPTTVIFEYGPTTSYGATIAGNSPGTGTGSVNVHADVTGLNPSTTFHFRITASNSTGTAVGGDLTFTTKAPVPLTLLKAATGVSFSGATLNGTVNPAGLPTTVTLEYGTTTAYGSVLLSEDIGSGTVPVPITGMLTNLTPNTVYYYRLRASNSSGGSSAVRNLRASEPVTQPATAITATSATLQGAVNPNGVSTTVTFEYGLTSNYGSKTAGKAISNGTTPVAVAVGITGLSVGATYHYRVVMTNSNVVSAGADVTFVATNPPQAAPIITSSLTKKGLRSSALSYQITASNAPTSYAATGLPVGLTLNQTSGLITGSASSAGTFEVAISASNAAGTGSAVLSLTVQTPYMSWKETQFGAAANDPAVAGDGIVHNGGGISNLLAYGLGLNPFTATAAHRPALGKVTLSGSSYLLLNFTRNPAATDLTYTVEASSSLNAAGSWAALSAWSGESWAPAVNVSESTGPAAVAVSVRDSQSMGSVPARGLRLKVSR